MEVYESPLHFLMTGSRFKPGHRFDGYEERKKHVNMLEIKEIAKLRSFIDAEEVPERYLMVWY